MDWADREKAKEQNNKTVLEIKQKYKALRAGGQSSYDAFEILGKEYNYSIDTIKSKVSKKIK
jgi:hypothetical protein